MARTTKPLTNTEIANAKPKDKKYPLTDGGGLFLLVKPNGAKLWRFNYYKPYTKNRTEIGLGSYPDVNLARAREIREEYRSLLSQNIDPHTHRQAIEQAKQTEIYNTFENVA